MFATGPKAGVPGSNSLRPSSESRHRPRTTSPRPNWVLVLALKLPSPKRLAVSTHPHIVFDLASRPRSIPEFLPRLTARCWAHCLALCLGYDPAMGFNRRKMEAERKAKADAEADARRATDAQVLQDAERLVGAWNERQARRMPLLFAPTIGAALAAPFPIGLLLIAPRGGSSHAHGRQCRGHQPDPGAIVSPVSGACTVRQTCSPVQNQRSRGDGSHLASPRGVDVSAGAITLG
jgi:hypothetical protein